MGGWLRDLERALLGALVASSLAALLLVARNGLAPLQPPLTGIASYGSREAPSLETAGSAAVDAEIEERLRALGYVE